MGVTAIRQPGSSLDVSLCNERAHAVDLAADWLAACQNTDGSWGSETDRVSRTSACLLAVTARAGVHSEACSRAAVWLDSHVPSTNEHADAHAWRVIALLSVSPDTPARSNLTQRLLQEAQPHAPDTNAWFYSQLLWRDALALAGQQPRPPPASETENTLALWARNWPPSATLQPYCLWLPSHLINRLSSGTLNRNGEPLDWRRDIARILINAQRRDPAGGGNWGQAEGDVRIRQTAFGVLTLQEL
jgi:hypothetical protein